MPSIGTMNIEFSAEARARIAERRSKMNASHNAIRKKNKKPTSSQNRASSLIDRGDTLNELRKAWGIEKKHKVKVKRVSSHGNMQPDMTKVLSFLKRIESR